MIQQLWNDDCGALISIEFLFFATIVILGLIVGLTTVRDAVVSELVELSQAIVGLNQSYAFSGISGCCSTVAGSQGIDSANGPIPPAVCTPVALPATIDDPPCN